MDVLKSYNSFLDSKNSKQAIGKIIDKGIELWKTKQAYEWYDNGCDYDRSGSVRQIPFKTIGDIASSDMEVLKAYTGSSTATDISGCGLSWNTVGHEIGYDITDYFSETFKEFITINHKELMEQFGYDGDYDDNMYDDLANEAYWYIIHQFIFNEMFPEYVVEETAEIDGKEVIFENEIIDNIW